MSANQLQSPQATSAEDRSIGAASHATAQGSSVREAFRLMATLIYPNIPLAYLDLCARILQRRHMETVFEERAVSLLCAFPPCGNSIRENNAKYRVSLKKKEIYDAHTENQFCSEQCLKKARVFTSRLVAKPPQLVPSLLDVFGTDKPNPFVWEKQQKELQVSVPTGGRRRAPKAKTVWSKTSDLGVVERPKAADPNEVLASLVASTPAISENAEPAAPTPEFPDVANAVLIEGFVFPSHKQSLAKKVERKWQESADSKGDEIIVSDSEESEISESEGESTGSVDMSDFDSDDVEEEIISTDDLPLFINIWRMLSEWITHDTNLLVARKALPEKVVPSLPKNAQEKKQREDAEHAAQLIFNERYNAFSLMLARQLPHVAQQLKLSLDRHASHRIDSLVKSFLFRDAIDGRNFHQWSCIAALLLLVAHDKHLKNMTSDELQSARTVTKLDSSELEQLLDLFYTLRDDSEVAIDDDVAPLVADDEEDEGKKRAAAYDAAKKCRRCRRPEAKCVCSMRAKSEKPANSEASTEEIEQMFRDAMTLRELNEDLIAASSAYDGVD